MTCRARVWLLAALLVSAAPVEAHTLSVSHVDVTEDPSGRVEVEVDVPLRDLALALPLDRDLDDRITWGELRGAQPAFERLVADGLALSTATGPCPLEPTGLATRRREDVAHATLKLSGRCPAASGLTVRYGLLEDTAADHAVMITLRGIGPTRVGTGRGATSVRFDAGATAGAQTFATFLRQGIHHILIGYDHLAFLLSLLLPAALVRKEGRWTPVERGITALKYTLGIVTAFTVAHSVTLSLAVLGIVTPASKPVEMAIAVSVLLAALNNVHPLVQRRLWLVGFVFGLIHGFGFAGALGEYELGRGSEALALVGFNLGVELGQLAVVVLALPLIVLLSRRRMYARYAMPIVSLAIAGWSLTWLWERASG